MEMDTLLWNRFTVSGLQRIILTSFVEMPNFLAPISEFIEALRKQGVLSRDEMVTDIYTEEQIHAELIVKED